MNKYLLIVIVRTWATTTTSTTQYRWRVINFSSLIITNNLYPLCGTYKTLLFTTHLQKKERKKNKFLSILWIYVISLRHEIIWWLLWFVWHIKASETPAFSAVVTIDFNPKRIRLPWLQFIWNSTAKDHWNCSFFS